MNICYSDSGENLCTLNNLLLSFHHVFCLCFGCRYSFSHVVVFVPATMGFGEPNPTYSVNRRRHCGLISDLQELIIRMSESDLNTYKLQLQQVEAALTTDPENEVLLSVYYCKRFIGNAKHVSQFCSTHISLSGTAAAENRPGAGACSHPRSYKCTAWCLSR